MYSPRIGDKIICIYNEDAPGLKLRQEYTVGHVRKFTLMDGEETYVWLKEVGGWFLLNAYFLF